MRAASLTGPANPAVPSAGTGADSRCPPDEAALLYMQEDLTLSDTGLIENTS